MKRWNALTASLLGSLSFNLLAAQPAEPASMDVYGFQFAPSLKLGDRYDDNFRTLPNRNAQSSWITSFNPKLQLQAETESAGYRLQYEGNQQTYWDARDADHTDHRLAFDSVLQFDSRNRLKWNLGYQKLESTVDSTIRTQNDKYTIKEAGLGYVYGLDDALNQIDVGANYQELRFQNEGGINDDQERNTTALRGTFYHALTEKTRALVEIRRSKFDYLTSNNPRNNTDTIAVVGAKWDATANTNGSLRVGQERKDFDSGSANDDQSLTWQVDASWKPLSYSTFTLKSRKAFDEGDDNAFAIHLTSTQLDWDHEWSSRIRTNLNVRHEYRDYQGGVAREDKTNGVGAGVTWQIRRWVAADLGYKHYRNDSTQDDETYTRNIYLIGLTFSL
jgi:hypothetical protein